MSCMTGIVKFISVPVVYDRNSEMRVIDYAPRIASGDVGDSKARIEGHNSDPGLTEDTTA